MTIAIQCPGCGQTAAADDASIGHAIRCMHCSRTFTVGMMVDGTVAPIVGPKTIQPPALNVKSGFEKIGYEKPRASGGSSPLKTIGRYSVMRKLGAGAMGVVWLAHDPNLERDVAIKVLPEAYAQDEAYLNRFLREARLAAKLQHPNTVTVHDVGTDGDLAYLVMELVEGDSLAKIIDVDGPMDWREATRAFGDAAAGLAAAHEIGLVHRDIKPENLMRTTKGVTKVVDFGLARSQLAETRFTQQGMLMGTPAYMAPELWMGQEADARSDLYALVLSYYHVLTGQLPFTAEQFVQVGHQHLHESLPDPRDCGADVPDPVCRILLRGAAKDPADRYSSAAELAADLEALLTSLPQRLTYRTAWEKLGGSLSSITPRAKAVSAPRKSQPPAWRSGSRPRPPERKSAWLTALAVVALGLCVLAAVFYVVTNKGLVKIEVLDPAAQVEVKVDGNKVDITGLHEPLRFWAGAHDLEVTSSEFQTFTRSFTVKRGETEVVRVTLEAKPKPNPASGPAVAVGTLDSGSAVVVAPKPARPQEVVVAKPADTPAISSGTEAVASGSLAPLVLTTTATTGHPVRWVAARNEATAGAEHVLQVEMMAEIDGPAAALLAHRYAAARDKYTEAIAAGRNEATSYAQRAWASLPLEDYSAALSDCDKTLALAPQMAAVHTVRGWALEGMHDRSGAKREYQLAVERLADATKPWLLYFRAAAYTGLGDAGDAAGYDRAVTDLGQAIQAMDDQPWFYKARAKVYHRQRRYELAAADLQKAIYLDPEHGLYRLALGDTLAQMGHAVDAEAAYNHALERLGTDDNRSLRARGDALLATGSRDTDRYNKALAAYDLALQNRPEDVAAKLGRGQVLAAQRNWAAAITAYDQALQVDPQNDKAYALRGAALAGQREYAKAIEDYNKAIQLRPGTWSYYRDRGRTWKEMKETAMAHTDLEEALSLLVPQGPADYQDSARICGDLGECTKETEFYDRAIADCAKAIKLDPKCAPAYYVRGVTCYLKKEFDDAIADLTKAVELDPKYAKAYENRGRAFAAKRDYAHAIADYTEAIELDPKYAKAYNNRGIALGAEGQHDQAIADYTKALELDPKYAVACNNRGRAYFYAKKDYDLAIADYTQAIVIDPKYAPAYLNRAYAFVYAKKDYDQAIADFTRVVELDPKNAGAYAARASAYHAKKDYDRAIDDYTQVINLEPSNLFAHYNSRGLVFFAKADYDRAIDDYTRAIELAPKFVFLYTNRGAAYFAKNEYAKARADYERALEINPNYAFAKEKLNQLERISGGQGHRSRPAPPAEQPKFWAPVPPAPAAPPAPMAAPRPGY